ncbi:SAM-dependent methyltransferase [Nocardiopsis salina]|uniref:SAM-dependent methyltransferase n=1 Tax=Nocardiopsis salina TaxID=245836 RepID=UPI00034D3DD6|nr:cyclopropane-fatty-acyl-phospholipid synthase family protein [Nocardiopsis salina]
MATATTTPHTPARATGTPALPYPRGAAHFLLPAAVSFVDGPPPFRIRAWDGSEAGPADAPLVIVRDRDALRHVLARPGELGLARAYVAGHLDVEGDLTHALRSVWAHLRTHGTRVPRPGEWARTVRTLLALGAVGTPPPVPECEARMSGRLHTRERDADAVSHHYDSGNDLYAFLLDASMAYSCAYWTSDADDYTLADAQYDKLALICRKLELSEGDHLLDLGCGWGSLALHAARHHGARVTAVTLSKEQRDHVLERAAQAGLGDRVQVRLCHFREAAGGPYDAVATVEMGEHVGEDEYRTLARRLHTLVRPGGPVLVQQMSRGADQPGGGPFIERYVAPDMHMRPLGRTIDLLEGGGLETRGVQALREHYVRTARAWLRTLESRFDEFAALVGDERARMWRLYLAGGALAFEEGRMGVDQILLRRPEHPGAGA